MASLVTYHDGIMDAARRMVSAPPSEHRAAIEQLRAALDAYDDLVTRTAKALEAQSYTAEQADIINRTGA